MAAMKKSSKQHSTLLLLFSVWMLVLSAINIAVYMSKQQTHIVQGSFESTIRSIEAFISAHPSYPDGYRELAEFYQHIGDTARYHEYTNIADTLQW